MSRAEEFIELYNRLSDHLTQITDRDDGYSFSALLDLAGERSSAVRAEARRLKDYGDLRNAIVHHRAYPREVIAEPTARAVEEFASIVDRVISPRRLIPTFSVDIRPFQPEERLVDALRYMGENDFSQIIVLKSGSLRMLTSEGIARWVERQTEDPIIDVSEATIDDALRHEIHGSSQLMGRNDTVYDAQVAFATALELFAIIITQNGRLTEKPLGIVTPWDLLEHAEA
jgi:CBS domain-containing protein